MHGHWDAPKEAAEADAKEAADGGAKQTADGDYFDLKKEYINTGIALVTPIDKLLKLIVESEWFEMVEKAARHLSAPLQGSVVLQVDLSTGDLISKVDLARISLPPGAPASTDSPEPIDRIRINRHQ
jgi:hypothetical protein